VSIVRLAADTARSMPGPQKKRDPVLPPIGRTFGIVAPGGDPPAGPPGVVARAGEPPAEGALPAAQQPPAQPSDPLAAALNGLTKFIPAETLTLFVAITGIIGGWKTATDPQTGAFLTSFFIFLALSPLFYVVATIVALRQTGKPFSLSARFAWRFIALTIAFVVWSFAVSSDTSLAVLGLFHVSDPNNHIRDIVSIAVLITSSVLTALDGLFPAP
jgi:hypothetical protein